MSARRLVELRRALLVAALAAGTPAAAADLGVSGEPGWGHGRAVETHRVIVTEEIAVCRPRRAPSNSPDDPSYVGSSYGLARPSYYGMPPPLGIDPLTRPLRFCR